MAIPHQVPGVQRIAIGQDFHTPVEQLYAYPSEHENLGPTRAGIQRNIRAGLARVDGKLK